MDKQGVRDPQVQEDQHGPLGIGSDARILTMIDGVCADERKQRVHRKDETVERCAVRNVVDLACDRLVWQWGLAGGDRDIFGKRLACPVHLPVLMALDNLEMGLGDEILPCVGDNSWVLVVRSMEDKKANVVIASLVGIIVEELVWSVRVKMDRDIGRRLTSVKFWMGPSSACSISGIFCGGMR